MIFNFSTQVKAKPEHELFDIYMHASEYNADFVECVEQELKHRNINYEELKQARMEQLNDQLSIEKEGRDGSPMIVFLGFVFALFGGIIGIIIGYHYSRSKKQAVNGESVFVYNTQTREWGNIIMWMGIAVALIAFIWKVLY